MVDPTVAAGIVFSNQAQVTANEMTGTEISPAVTVTVRGADIEVTKTASVTTVAPEQQFTYTVQATNHGPSDAQNVSLSDLLPGSVTYVSHTASTGTYNQVSGLWMVGNLANGGTATLNIVVSVPSTATIGSIIHNTATLLSGSTPPQGGSAPDSDSVEVTVSGGGADLALGMTVNPNGTVVSGTQLVYTLMLTNNGPSNVTGSTVQDVMLADAFASGMLQFVSAAPNQGTFSPSTGQWTGISLNAGQTAAMTITVTAVGTPDENVVFTNTASIISGAVPDPNPANNTATVSIQIDWPAPLSIGTGTLDGGWLTVERHHIGSSISPSWKRAKFA